MMNILNLRKKSRRVATVFFNMRPAKGPWGGSSAFVESQSELLKHRGYEVSYKLAKKVDLIVMIDPRKGEMKPYSLRELVEYKKMHPDTVIIQRINECDQRKNTDFIDELLKNANAIADHTVFISKWLLDYHANKWFDCNLPHSVIYNGANPVYFHPIGCASYNTDSVFKIVTHHWSHNMLKGFDIYKEVDDLISNGKLPNVELTIIGNWPQEIHWKSAKTFPPIQGYELADKLREYHAYITASRWEPCGMHHVEGAQCGLPLLYHEDGGAIVEMGIKYGIGFRDDVESAIKRMIAEYGQYKRKVLSDMPSGDKMNFLFANIIQRLLSERNLSLYLE